jgi:hypothetical protein
MTTFPPHQFGGLPVKLKGFAIITPESPLEGGVLVEFWDGPDRRTAQLPRAVLDDLFDRLHPFRPPDQRVSESNWRRLVEENRPAFERVITAKYQRAVASSGHPVLSIEVDHNDIQNSGESFTRDALLDAGMASSTTGTWRPSLP